MIVVQSFGGVSLLGKATMSFERTTEWCETLINRHIRLTEVKAYRLMSSDCQGQVLRFPAADSDSTVMLRGTLAQCEKKMELLASAGYPGRLYLERD